MAEIAPDSATTTRVVVGDILGSPGKSYELIVLKSQPKDSFTEEQEDIYFGVRDLADLAQLKKVWELGSSAFRYSAQTVEFEIFQLGKDFGSRPDDQVALIESYRFRGNNQGIEILKRELGSTAHPDAATFSYVDIGSIKLGQIPSFMYGDVLPPYSVRNAVSDAGFDDFVRANGGQEAANGALRIPEPLLYLNQLRKFCEHRGLYLPKLRLIEGAQIDGDSYLESFAAGEYPVAINSLSYFRHDAQNNHLEALVTYGEPAMEFCSLFAQAVLETDTVQYKPYLSEGVFARDKTVTLSGVESRARATDYIDSFTAQLAGLSFDTDGPDAPALMSNRGFAVEPIDRNLSGHVGAMVEAIRVAGLLPQLSIAESLQDKGVSLDDINGSMVLHELVDMAQQRGVAFKPVSTSLERDREVAPLPGQRPPVLPSDFGPTL